MERFRWSVHCDGTAGPYPIIGCHALAWRHAEQMKKWIITVSKGHLIQRNRVVGKAPKFKINSRFSSCHPCNAIAWEPHISDWNIKQTIQIIHPKPNTFNYRIISPAQSQIVTMTQTGAIIFVDFGNGSQPKPQLPTPQPGDPGMYLFSASLRFTYQISGYGQ